MPPLSLTPHWEQWVTNPLIFPKHYPTCKDKLTPIHFHFRKSASLLPHFTPPTPLTNNNFIPSIFPRPSHVTSFQNPHSTHITQKITWKKQSWEAKFSFPLLIHELNNTQASNIEIFIKNPFPIKLHARVSMTKPILYPFRPKPHYK
jgi:hypothetical protein